MHIRKLVLVAAAAALPFTLTACGGASVEDFCEQFQGIDELGDGDADQAKDKLSELADNVPSNADDVQKAVDFMAESFPADGDLEKAIQDGDVSGDEAAKFGSAATTITDYAGKNCES